MSPFLEGLQSITGGNFLLQLGFSAEAAQLTSLFTTPQLETLNAMAEAVYTSPIEQRLPVELTSNIVSYRYGSFANAIKNARKLNNTRKQSQQPSYETSAAAGIDRGTAVLIDELLTNGDLLDAAIIAIKTFRDAKLTLPTMATKDSLSDLAMALHGIKNFVSDHTKNGKIMRASAIAIARFAEEIGMFAPILERFLVEDGIFRGKLRSTTPEENSGVALAKKTLNARHDEFLETLYAEHPRRNRTLINALFSKRNSFIAEAVMRLRLEKWEPALTDKYIEELLIQYVYNRCSFGEHVRMQELFIFWKDELACEAKIAEEHPYFYPYSFMADLLCKKAESKTGGVVET